MPIAESSFAPRCRCCGLRPARGIAVREDDPDWMHYCPSCTAAWQLVHTELVQATDALQFITDPRILAAALRLVTNDSRAHGTLPAPEFFKALAKKLEELIETKETK